MVTQSAEEKLTSRFIRLTGIKEADIASLNTKRYTFVTHAGGKYVMDRKGTKVRRLMGPRFPKEPEA